MAEIKRLSGKSHVTQKNLGSAVTLITNRHHKHFGIIADGFNLATGYLHTSFNPHSNESNSE